MCAKQTKQLFSCWSILRWHHFLFQVNTTFNIDLRIILVWICNHWMICIISLIYAKARNDIRLWRRARHLGLQYSYFNGFSFFTHMISSMSLGVLNCLENIADDTQISHYTCLYNLRTCQFLERRNVSQDKCHGLSIGFEQLHLLISKWRRAYTYPVPF